MRCAWVLLGLAIGGAGVARAADFEFSYIANGVSVMGIFNTTSEGKGEYQINSITNGTRGSIPITLLAPQSPLVSAANDNMLYFPNPGAGYLDTRGFGFTDGNDDYRTYSMSDNKYKETDYTSDAVASGFPLQVTPVPAPIPGGGLLSFLALGVAGLAWRRRAIAGFGRGLRARRAV